MVSDVLKALVIVSIMVVVGIVLAIIGIQHEHLTKLRDEKAELKVLNQDQAKKIEELEKQVKMLNIELSKYDKKRAKELKKEMKKENKGENSKAVE